MKKIITILISITLIAVLFTGCNKPEENTIKIGASITPHSEILEVAKEILSTQGYTLDIVEYNDYVLPNTATQDGELHANYLQHLNYLTNLNNENNTNLVPIATIQYEP